MSIEFDGTKPAALDDEEREALERVKGRAAPKVRDADDPTAEDELPSIPQGAGPGVIFGEVGS